MGGLNDAIRYRENKMIFQFSLIGGKMNAADVGGCHLQSRVRKRMFGEIIFEPIEQ
jgi:hypothetical protein